MANDRGEMNNGKKTESESKWDSQRTCREHVEKLTKERRRQNLLKVTLKRKLMTRCTPRCFARAKMRARSRLMISTAA